LSEYISEQYESGVGVSATIGEEIQKNTPSPNPEDFCRFDFEYLGQTLKKFIAIKPDYHPANVSRQMPGFSCFQIDSPAMRMGIDFRRESEKASLNSGGTMV
jgi:hypothetical protein